MSHRVEILRNSSFLRHAVENSFLSQQADGCVKFHHKSFVKNHDPENIKYYN